MPRYYCWRGIVVAILLLQQSLALADTALAVPLSLSVNFPQQTKQMSQTSSDRLPPNVISALRQDLSRRTDISPDKFQILQVSPQTWPDGCLGLAKPEEFCLQMLVEGWRVAITDGRQTWTYRTDTQGRILRRETEDSSR